MNKRDVPPDQVVLDIVLRWDVRLFTAPHTATVVGDGPYRLALFAVNHQDHKVQQFIDLNFDGFPEDGPPPRFLMYRLGPGVWKVTPSVVVPGMLHAYLTIIGVPEPLPWQIPPVDSTAHQVVGKEVSPGVPDTSDRGDGQQRGYLVLSDGERAKGFIRPLRTSYRHLKCGTVTEMGLKLAETYARFPGFYGATFCVGCKTHLPVGKDGEFVWDGTDVKVGT